MRQYKDMKVAKKILIVVMLLAGFVFGVSFSTLYAQTHIYEGTACTCTLPIPLLIPTFASLGVLVGSVVYYIMFPKSEDSKEISKEVIEKFLNFIPGDEGEVLKLLFENNGEISQSKISAKLGRVKAFRVIERLKARGLIEKMPYGKTNMIKLSEEIKKVL